MLQVRGRVTWLMRRQEDMTCRYSRRNRLWVVWSIVWQEALSAGCGENNRPRKWAWKLHSFTESQSFTCSPQSCHSTTYMALNCDRQESSFCSHLVFGLLQQGQLCLDDHEWNSLKYNISRKKLSSGAGFLFKRDNKRRRPTLCFEKHSGQTVWLKACSDWGEDSQRCLLKSVRFVFSGTSPLN